ncbi:hypothetical protein MO867_21965 [Microbulbifer sp. OS29]|uniref:Uncharacterized protein n=1 Tax=Microbulbifer okhotskensis TaxID=2926617 RepID=A0A9X2EXF5_9GAMM|nr:hypothetical protein [Microbulbifer okhotskensis]MCO1336993.1 hypothetical protein [Microbulbifer okhotskensis]
MGYIPQHFLQYAHTRETIEELLLDIHYDEQYPIFVCEDKSGVYIQIGIISYDNYIPLIEQSSQKIVYGRKWRVEADLPTSEIIQTVFLALQKAREHEVRERLKLSLGPANSTPFNTHQDLPLMAELSKELTLSIMANTETNSIEQVNHWLEGISYDAARFTNANVNALSYSGYYIEVSIDKSPTTRLPELDSQTIIFSTPHLDRNTIYHRLMEAMVNLSNRHVAENFTYKGFARFSINLDLLATGRLSLASRSSSQMENSTEFSREFSRMNDEVDSNRVPAISKGELGLNLIRQLLSFLPLNGFLPK